MGRYIFAIINKIQAHRWDCSSFWNIFFFLRSSSRTYWWVFAFVVWPVANVRHYNHSQPYTTRTRVNESSRTRLIISLTTQIINFCFLVLFEAERFVCALLRPPLKKIRTLLYRTYHTHVYASLMIFMWMMIAFRPVSGSLGAIRYICPVHR